MATITNIKADNLCVLIFSDEIFAQQASLDLHSAGYCSVVGEDAVREAKHLHNLQPAMIVIDQAWQAEPGWNFCRQLRSSGYRTPILMLVERETVEERVACLQAGADDYLLKPYKREEFLKLIRLYLQPEVSVKEQIRFGELVLDLTTRRVIRSERAIELTMKEFELLKYLMFNPGKVLTRDQIIENVWGYDYRGESNVIEVYIRYLRLKIESEGQKRLIQTVRGVGYVLREQ
ncbi:MAG: response regulator transcription factor [Xenococcaceae cyanobacterium MO_188.B32]|nr:response regulator transcription factor [Xenococcaceae cyanobacterium MO_188.B32]